MSFQAEIHLVPESAPTKPLYCDSERRVSNLSKLNEQMINQVHLVSRIKLREDTLTEQAPNPG
jgi:hypothetical protein